MSAPGKSPRTPTRCIVAKPRATAATAGRPTLGLTAGHDGKARIGKAPDTKAVGAGPARLSSTAKVKKALELQATTTAGLAGKARVKELQKEYWIDPRTPYLPGRASLRVVDGTWFYTDEPSIGLSPYGGNTGGADLRIFFKPVLKNRAHLISFALTVMASQGKVTLSALGVQQATTLQQGGHWISMLVTPSSSDTFTILLGVDGANPVERVAVHGCDISLLG